MVAVTVLGEQSVVDPDTGRTVTRSARSLALIGLLVSRAGAPVTRSWIAGAFWPDSGDRQALTNLRRELHQLRQLVPDDTLEVTAGHVAWHDVGRHRVDLADFLREAAAAGAAGEDEGALAHGRAALAAYGGDLLPGLDEPWADDARDQVRGRCAGLCERVADAAERMGRIEEATQVMQRRVGLDAYDEPAHRRLMALQARAGDRAGAVRTFHRLAGRLELDLGVKPDPDTSALLRRLTRPAARPSGAAEDDRRGPAGSGLVGRRGELQALASAWRAARAGRAGVAVVGGAAGVGKSRLVAELEAGVETDRGLVCRARCFDSSGRMSLAPVAEWLRSPGVLAGRVRLDPVWQREVARLLPTGDDPAEADGTRDAGPLDLSQQHRFFEGLARSLLAVERPTLLVLDNLQWCDADTLGFASLLLALAPEAPLLLVAATRTDAAEVNPEAGRWLDRLRQGGLLVEVDLGPLAAADTARLAAGLGGPALTRTDLGLLHEATGGFPLYVVESLRVGTAPPDPSEPSRDPWAGVLERRLRAVSPAAQQVAQLAAAVGRDFTLPLLVEASELTADGVVLGVDELWRARILVDQREGYDFSHDLLREAAYALVSPPRRWLLHRRLADALTRAQADGSDAGVALLADQHRLAGDHDRAAGLYERAAQAAERVFAHAEARRLVRLALAELRRLPESSARDERELAMLHTLAPILLSLEGWTSSELERTASATDVLARRLERPEDVMTAGQTLAAVYIVQGRVTESERVDRAAIEAAERTGLVPTIGILFSLGGCLLHLGQVVEARGYFERAMPVPDGRIQVGVRTRSFTYAWGAHAAWAAGEPQEAVELADRAIRQARDEAHIPSLVISLVYGGITWLLLQRPDRCAEAAAEAEDVCRRHSLGYYVDVARILQAWCRGPAGRPELESALAALREARALFRMPLWLMLLADVTADPAAQPRLLAEAEALIERTDERLWLPEVWRRQAAHLPDDAAAPLLARAEALAAEQGNRAYVARCAADRAERFANASVPSVPAPLPTPPEEPS